MTLGNRPFHGSFKFGARALPGLALRRYNTVVYYRSILINQRYKPVMNIPHRRILFTVSFKERGIVDEVAHAVVCRTELARLGESVRFSILILYGFASIVLVGFSNIGVRDR